MYLNRKQNPCCPIDNIRLSASDLFTDNSRRREIQQMKKPCPNAERGCKLIESPPELDAHILECAFREQTIIYECSYKRSGCTFETNVQNDLEQHMKTNLATHLNVSFF